MRIASAVALLLVCAGLGRAAAPAPLDWGTARRSEESVAPGVKLVSLSFPGKPCEIRMVSIDLATPGLGFRVRHAHETLGKVQGPDAAAADLEKAGAHPLAGINADFFAMGGANLPQGLSVSNGRIYSTGYDPNCAGWSFGHLWETSDGALHVGRLSLAARIRFSATNDCPIVAINADVKAPSGAALYDSNWPFPLPAPGLRLRLQRAPAVGKNQRCVVAGLAQKGETLSGDEDEAVVTFFDAAMADRFLRPTAAGKPVVLDLDLAGSDGPVRQAVRVWVAPLVDGTIRDTHENDDYPRSLFGMAPGRFILFAADGRQKGWSNSLPSRQAAEVLQREGCTFAGQFDGGGSTALWVRGHGIVNRPSGGGKVRPVANTIFFTLP